MKKLLVLVLLLFILGGAVFSQNISPKALDNIVGALETDFGLLLKGLGNDVDPILLQNAISGQNIGQAELGDTSFYIGLPSINLTVSPGFLKFRKNQDYFELLDLNKLLNDKLLSGLSDSIGQDYTDILLDKAFPFPALKGNFGFKLPANLELLVNGAWIPSFLTKNFLDKNLAKGLSLDYINIGGVLRYVLLKDVGSSPAVSIGAGSYYNKVYVSMSLKDSLREIADTEEFDKAKMELSSDVLAFGIDLAVSKVFLFFNPYLKLGAWYSINSFKGEVVLLEDGNRIENGTNINDFNLLVSTGFDILLGAFRINIGGDYNLGNGVWGVNLGSRLQF